MTAVIQIHLNTSSEILRKSGTTSWPTVSPGIGEAGGRGEPLSL